MKSFTFRPLDCLSRHVAGQELAALPRRRAATRVMVPEAANVRALQLRLAASYFLHSQHHIEWFRASVCAPQLQLLGCYTGATTRGGYRRYRVLTK